MSGSLPLFVSPDLDFIVLVPAAVVIIGLIAIGWLGWKRRP